MDCWYKDLGLAIVWGSYGKLGNVSLYRQAGLPKRSASVYWAHKNPSQKVQLPVLTPSPYACSLCFIFIWELTNLLKRAQGEKLYRGIGEVGARKEGGGSRWCKKAEVIREGLSRGYVVMAHRHLIQPTYLHYNMCLCVCQNIRSTHWDIFYNFSSRLNRCVGAHCFQPV